VSCAWLGERVAVSATRKVRVKKLARILKRLSGAFRMQSRNQPSKLMAQVCGLFGVFKGFATSRHVR
jgi:hypothetical protein